MNDKKLSSDHSNFSNSGLNLKNDNFPQMYDDYDVEAVSELLKSSPFLINKANEMNGTTLLFRSVLNNNYNITEMLLENGANPNLQNCYGETSLHQAVENRSHKMINLLLDNKANPNIQQKDGETPMHIACVKGDYKIVKLMLHYGANPRLKTYQNEMTALDYAIEMEKIKCVEVLQPIMEGDSQSSKQKMQNMGNISVISNSSGIGPIGGFNQGFRTMKNSNSQANQDFGNHPSINMGMNVNNTSKNSNINSSIRELKNFNNISSINHNNNFLGNNFDFDDRDRKQMMKQQSEVNLKKQQNLNNSNNNGLNAKVSNSNMNMNMNHTNNYDQSEFRGEDQPTLMNTKFFEDKFLKMKMDINQLSNFQDMKTNYNSNTTLANNNSSVGNFNNNSFLKDQMNQSAYNNYNSSNKLSHKDSNKNLNTFHKKSRSNVGDIKNELLFKPHLNNFNLNNISELGKLNIGSYNNGNNSGNALNNESNISGLDRSLIGKGMKKTISNKNMINVKNQIGGNVQSSHNLLDSGLKEVAKANFRKNSDKYDFNIEKNRVITLKPEEFLDTYEKFDSKDDSRMISPGNVMMNDNSIYGFGSVRNKPGASVVNDNKYFGENYRKSYDRISEYFNDQNNVLALFVSNKNDIDYENKDANPNNISELNFNYNEIYEQQPHYNSENSNEELNLSDENNNNFNTSKKSIKYFSKSNASIKDEYKQISLDTQTIMNNHEKHEKQKTGNLTRVTKVKVLIAF